MHRVTVGYLSADFQEHATAHLISELFELHDRSRFRVIGYSYGTDDGSPARRKLRDSFDAFVDLENVSHHDAAARIRADGVDILVDLKGYTTDARPEIVALRPAPVQVSYLGLSRHHGDAGYRLHPGGSLRRARRSTGAFHREARVTCRIAIR